MTRRRFVLTTLLMLLVAAGSAAAQAPRPPANAGPVDDDEHAGFGAPRRAGADVRASRPATP